MKKIFIFVIGLMVHVNSFALDAQGNGNGWISLGVPNYIHMGTDGRFYLNGTHQGQCAGVRPQYFRLNMDKPHFKEFYSWLLSMQVQKKSLDCVVDSGCGSDQVWVSYCRGGM
ncbi:hypothetical protein [Vibrio spartinae]|uniref:Uncharacterized protein n=1 Tax=Vibrio spartinae TaxID=1918945 RepID=A0A1N6M1K6_9VIBR|nr:hypothetical protein [Vibrio spartinae]QMV15445.1 hypothetical protein Vspart_02752 [Vibrio spartinae]SIO93313.1 hypothetical protein VSP9026_00972 [Vibrio spartinae]